MKNLNIFIIIAWAIATLSTLGSLFFSEIMLFSPCTLCWYQRIAMYPLVIILGLGYLQDIKESIIFALPFSVIGWIVALYHNLLHYGIVPESASPCRSGIPCSTVYINWFGFLTIPMLSFIAFSIITIILIYIKKGQSHAK